ncbi:hypothetical protein COO20_05315 [Thalassospira marina]|uniref:Uncharacterized protein n=1 Tax=Thalassospira marina TaxID=2048283 RepID=A0A2N3KYD4_9PROT|nr:hypothetical protein COO20_05315 [Thalassospira marina]
MGWFTVGHGGGFSLMRINMVLSISGKTRKYVIKPAGGILPAIPARPDHSADIPNPPVNSANHVIKNGLPGMRSWQQHRERPC